MNESLAEMRKTLGCLEYRVGCRGIPSRTGNQKVVDKQVSEKHLSVGSSLCTRVCSVFSTVEVAQSFPLTAIRVLHPLK